MLFRSSHPLGQKVSTCGAPQIRRHRGGLGMDASLLLFSVYTDYNTSRRKINTDFSDCICTCEENEELQREHPFDAGFPIGASGIPVGTRFSVGKSSVLYLCFRLTLERGWLHHLLCGQIADGSHFSAAVGQADFVRTRTKSVFAQRAKSD